MKVFLVKPVKIKGKWHEADTEVDVAKGEAERLGKKGACVIPMTEANSQKAADEEKE